MIHSNGEINKNVNPIKYQKVNDITAKEIANLQQSNTHIHTRTNTQNIDTLQIHLIHIILAH